MLLSGITTNATWAATAAVSVPAFVDIALAGQPSGTTVGNDSAPLNSPALVPLQFAAGQFIQVSASGTVQVSSYSPSYGPDGSSTNLDHAGGAFGISQIYGPSGALIGVFLGSGTPFPQSTPPVLDFSGSAQELPTLRPLLQQPFYIGRGSTTASEVKTFVVPPGASRLFLAVLESRGSTSDNTGSFSVTASLVPGPPLAIFPRVFGIDDIALSGQPDGQSTGSDSAPMNAPVPVPVTVTPGDTLQISASGTVQLSYYSSSNGPDGSSSNDHAGGAFGISQIYGPSGALIGVFLGSDVPNGSAYPPDTDYSGSARDQTTLRPLLQQPFYIGRGSTTAGLTKSFVVPTGASRLFLGILEGRGYLSGNVGWFQVAVTSLASRTKATLSQGRVTVEVRWQSQYSGESGTAFYIPQKDEFAFFYYTDPNNPEVFVKVLDFGAGTALVFVGGLTDFYYKVTFTVLRTGQTLVFEKPPSQYIGFVDATTLKF